jgi:4-diphosphocytidyl-2-C-methyl-D-erythritol kinase
MPEDSSQMPEVEAVRVDALAKLTLSLHVTGTRADGYHLLDATMVSISEPHDSLVIRRTDATSLTVTGPFAGDVPADSSNLAWRAADACRAQVAIELHKGIPSGAGLGGGSADAAAVLSALGGDAAIAAALGADVPFCLRGGFAIVRGIGDELERGESLALAVVVVTPPFACSTADVYRAWDALGGPHDDVNDLRPAAEHVEPRLVEFRRAVETAAGAPAILAGSGSSYALVFEHAVEAERARDRIAAAVSGSVWLGATAPHGVLVDP